MRGVFRLFKSFSLVLLIALAGFGSVARADVPSTIAYQGMLTDSLGSPVADSSYQVTFTIYDDPVGGLSKWSETRQVATIDGLFAVVLGQINPLSDSVFSDVIRYLAMAVDPDLEMSPRTPLLSVPYAFSAVNAEHATTAIDADNAAHASDADNATHAENADHAEHASSADHATNAINSENAVKADSANRALFADSANSITDGGVGLADIGNNGAAAGQIMKFDGTNWVLGTDESGGSGGWADSGLIIYLEDWSDRVGIGGVPASAKLHVANTEPTGTQWGVYGEAGSTDENIGVRGFAANGSSNTGVYGQSVNGAGPNYAFQGYAVGSNGPQYGVYAESDNTSSGYAYGSYSLGVAKNGAGIGAYGYGATEADSAIGVYGAGVNVGSGGMGIGGFFTASGQNNPMNFGILSQMYSGSNQDSWGGYLNVTKNSGFGFARGLAVNVNKYGGSDAAYGIEASVYNTSGYASVGSRSVNTTTSGTERTYGISGTNYHYGTGDSYGATLYGAGYASVYGLSAKADVYSATGGSGYGVYGEANGENAASSYYGGYFHGQSISAPTYGVRANVLTQDGGIAYGVYSTTYATNGTEFAGYFDASSVGTAEHYGVRAIGGTTSANAYGLSAKATSVSGGAYGGYFNSSTSNNGTSGGVYATAQSSGTGFAYALYGYAYPTGTGAHYGLYAYEAAGGSGAAVYASGDFIASGTKSAVVRTSQGERLYYAVESPEVWFEDVGTGQLVNGQSRVDLDPLFLESIDVSTQEPLKVFIQLNGDCNGTYVVSDMTGFEVHELQRGTSNAPFTWKVMGKRKGYATERLRATSVGNSDPNLYPDRADEIRMEMEARQTETAAAAPQESNRPTAPKPEPQEESVKN